MPFRGHAFLTAAGVIVTSSHQDKTVAPVSVTVQIPYRYEKVTQAFSVHLPAWAVLTSIHFFLSFFFFVCFFLLLFFHPLILGCHGKKGLWDRLESPCLGKPDPVTPSPGQPHSAFTGILFKSPGTCRGILLWVEPQVTFSWYIYIYFFLLGAQK